MQGGRYLPAKFIPPFKLMKKFLLVLILLTFMMAGNQVVSQTIQATDTKVKVEKVDRPALSISCELQAKDLQDAWDSWLKKNYKVKADKKGDAVTALAASIPEVSTGAFDLNATFNSSKEGCEMIVTAAAGYDIYFSPKDHSEEYKKLKMLVENFVRTQVAEYYDKLIKEQQKVVDASVKVQEDTDKEIAKLQKDIEDANQTIEKLKAQIEENNATIKKDNEALPGIKETIEKNKTALQELLSKKLNATGK